MAKDTGFYNTVTEYFDWLGKIDAICNDTQKPPCFSDLCVDTDYKLIEYFDDCYNIIQIKAEDYLSGGKYATLLQSIRECNVLFRRVIQTGDSSLLGEVRHCIQCAGQSVGDLLFVMESLSDKHELTPDETSILQAMADAGESLIKKEIQRLSGIPISTVRSRLDKLVKHDYAMAVIPGGRSGWACTEKGLQYLKSKGYYRE